MGNKLCAPLLSKKSHPQHNQPWHTRKDSNLLRLWAEIFCVTGQGDYMQWKRVSEDVVPINITCIEDTPKTVFHVTAYNRHVEKIFDIKILQPGTILCPATDSFVHWRDFTNNSEWGLNFTTPQDAKRFRDCCSVTSQKYVRKASSANSLRLSPPKSKGRAVSSPNSPVHNDPRRAVSSPYDLNQVEPCECITPSGERETLSRVDKAATIPRTQSEAGSSGHKSHPRGILKPSSTSTAVSHDSPNHETQSMSLSPTRADNRGNGYHGSRSASAGPLSSEELNRKSGGFTSFGKSSQTCDNIRLETAFVGKYENSSRETENHSTGRKSVTIAATTPDEREIEPSSSDDIESNNTVTVHKDCIRILAPQPQKLLPDSPRGSSPRGSRHSESPEWPSPPEPLTPQTPQTPTYNLDFDSEEIKRMLENLPLSPETDSITGSIHEEDLGFHEDAEKTVSVLNKSGVSETCDEETKNNTECKQVNCDNSEKSDKPDNGLQLLDCEIARRKCLRDSYGRDSNPDSGIGGMACDVAVSLSSSDSTNLQTTGLDVTRNELKGGSTGASSHDGSNSSHLSHSDILSQFAEGQFLTAELSDDEDDAGSDDSIHTVTEAESQFSYAKQHGAIRKAGWLVVKNWLVQKKQKLELAPRRTWKRYYACLKGTVLLFYDGNTDNVTLDDNVPKHMLVIEGGISQAVPEHPKRDYIFSLSTAFGDAYLFQASSQTELDSWVSAIHSACAGSFARQHGKDNIVRLLRTELHKLDTNVDIDVKMRKMAELQLTVVSDPRSRHAIIKQIHQWEENLEKLNIEQYRLRCYSASIQGSELPNPKVLLSNVSKTSKGTLSRLGIFTVSSFHALVCARKPLVLPSLYGKGTRKGAMLSPRGDGMFKYHSKTSTLPMTSSTQCVYKASELDEIVGDIVSKDGSQSPSGSTGSNEVISKVTAPNNQSVMVGIKKATTAEDVLLFVCNRRQLNPREHYVRVRLQGAPEGSYQYPDRQENIKKLRCELVEVCQKHTFQVELNKADTNNDFGLKIEAELAEDCDKEDDLRVYVADVRSGSLAECKGLHTADEIVVLNGKIVSDLDMVYVENLLTESCTICLTVRSRIQPPGNVTMETPMPVPPPPSQSRLSDYSIDNLKIPPPSSGNSSANTSCQNSPHHSHYSTSSRHSTDQVDALLLGADQVTAICRESCEDISISNRQMSEVERLHKVIKELVDTEEAYVNDLNCLLKRYLEPLKEEHFLTSDEVDHIFGNIQEIAQFQRQFLHSLIEAIGPEMSFVHGSEFKHYRRVLFSLGGSFLFYANHFKVYSSFCASHSRSQKILNPDTINEKLKGFLIARNPKNQHSATLDSYLIKPIQRILKYPLLLQQLCNLTDPETDEHHHLSEARKGMEAVAEHINEMQKIYEEYGAIFDELSKMFKDLYPQKTSVDLSVGELQMYGTVEWCNVSDSLGKIKKGTELESTVFVFKAGVVFLCRERLKRRKTRGGAQGGKGLFSESYDTTEKFRTLIPVQDVQVRIGKVSDIDGHFWWELVHSRCDPDARPERVYHFCNSTIEAKTDFMRIIRQTIRDSVRKMTLPSNSNSKNKYIPYGGKRLEALSSNPRSTLSKKRNSSGSKSSDVERHSMELEEKFRVLEDDGVFRTRSRTVGDLNESDCEEETEEFV